ncbi:Lrp/AsnC family transcriptional regulator [Nonomuraea sp. NEAU-A123]|uniref:Lrp/AsnC family transcriptional regulator n=1 Tax=Nonomuraea sp. NEAU-A123 TaxID=2839649 RepID=UPI001BE484B4|nr:AsnC family transcriptional regulator [Nonomuraea sp. NEAU-A123]MBT2224817.1 Lrp/AsnC family transcriptional regulator [Nonomuraea sp. NEAU-A123]
MESDMFTDLDRQITHALQVDARAPFSRIGEVLGVSDQTVARRYARLRSAGLLRVVGLANPLLTGHVHWFLRLRCAPGAAPPMAEALARRDDTSWVYLTSVGTEIFCAVRAQPDESGGEELLKRLPHTPRLLSVEAHRVLHLFYGGSLSLLEKYPALSEEQVERLKEHVEPATPLVDLELTAADRRILAVLRHDARVPITRLVSETGMSAITLRHRMAALRLSGAMYFDVEFDPRLFGLGLRTIIWLTVSPANLKSIGQALAGHRETAFVVATTGSSGLCVSVSCEDGAALYDYLTSRVAPLRGIHHLETAPVLRAVKYGGSLTNSPPHRF